MATITSPHRVTVAAVGVVAAMVLHTVRATRPGGPAWAFTDALLEVLTWQCLVIAAVALVSLWSQIRRMTSQRAWGLIGIGVVVAVIAYVVSVIVPLTVGPVSSPPTVTEPWATLSIIGSTIPQLAYLIGAFVAGHGVLGLLDPWRATERTDHDQHLVS